MRDMVRADSDEVSHRYVALLRGINVGGRRKLLMRDLAAIFVTAGCADVRTYIQSGNVVFEAAPTVANGLPRGVAAAIGESHGFQVPVVIRAAEDLDRIVRDNPFLAAGADPAKLHVGFLAAAPDPTRIAQLDPDRSPPDAFEVRDREVYLHFPAGVARSKLDNGYFDRTLNTVCTIRNWRTVCKLREMAGDI